MEMVPGVFNRLEPSWWLVHVGSRESRIKEVSLLPVRLFVSSKLEALLELHTSNALHALVVFAFGALNSDSDIAANGARLLWKNKPGDRTEVQCFPGIRTHTHTCQRVYIGIC